MSTSTRIAGPLFKMGRAELAQIPVPLATRTHHVSSFSSTKAR